MRYEWWPISIPMAGDNGVDVFLVLSGFLLGSILAAELEADGRVNYLRFYARRWFRIEPGYASAMVIQCLAMPRERMPSACPSLWWSNLMFMNNIWPVQNFLQGPACMVHTWSIAVEFQMYLLTPPLLVLSAWLARGVRERATPCYFGVLSLAWLGCCAVRTFSVFYKIEHGVFYGQAKYTLTIARIAPYVAGAMAAIAVRQHKEAPYHFPGPRARSILMVLSWAVLLAGALTGAEPMYFGSTSREAKALYGALPQLKVAQAIMLRPLTGLAVAFLLACALTGKAPKLNSFLSAPAWRPLAVLSYSMYLLQYVGGLPWDAMWVWLVGGSLDVNQTPVWYGVLLANAKFPAVVGCTLPLALINYVCVERPSLKWGQTVAAMLSAAAPKRELV